MTTPEHVMQSVWALVRSGPNFDGQDQCVQDAVRAAIQAAVVAEREACAELCDTRSADHWHDYKNGPNGIRGSALAEHASDEADRCGVAIRARGITPPPPPTPATPSLAG